MTVDASFNVFVSDGLNDRIVKFNGSGAEIAQYTASDLPTWFPSGVHVDIVSGALYAADLDNARIVRFDLQHGRVDAASHQPCYPFTGGLRDVALGADGSVFAADYTNRRIVKANSAHAVVTVYTTHSPSLSGPGGVAVDAADSLFIADTNNHRVVRLNANGSRVAEFASPPLNTPTDVALDADGQHVFVADMGNNSIAKLNATTGDLLAIFITSNPSLFQPRAVAVEASGEILVADSRNFRIVRLSSIGVELAAYPFHPGSSAVPDLDGIAVDSLNFVYVTESQGGRVVKLNASGMEVAEFRSNPPPGSLRPYGVAVDDAGGVFVALDRGSRVVKFDAMGILQDVYFQRRTQLLANPGGMALTAAGHLIVANADLGQAVELSSTGNQLRTFTTSPPMAHITGVAVDDGGNIFLSEPDNRAVKLSSTGDQQLAVYNTTKLRDVRNHCCGRQR